MPSSPPMILPMPRFISRRAHLLAVLLCTACGGSERPDAPDTSQGTFTPPPQRQVPAQPAGNDVATGSCEAGVSRDCRVWLPTSGGQKNCFVGTQVCVDDAWSGCLGDSDAAVL